MSKVCQKTEGGFPVLAEIIGIHTFAKEINKPKSTNILAVIFLNTFIFVFLIPLDKAFKKYTCLSGKESP